MDSKKVPSYFEMDKEERLQLFKQAQSNMISTSANAYNNEWGNRKTVTYLTFLYQVAFPVSGSTPANLRM